MLQGFNSLWNKTSHESEAWQDLWLIVAYFKCRQSNWRSIRRIWAGYKARYSFFQLTCQLGSQSAILRSRTRRIRIDAPDWWHCKFCKLMILKDVGPAFWMSDFLITDTLFCACTVIGLRWFFCKTLWVFKIESRLISCLAVISMGQSAWK